MTEIEVIKLLSGQWEISKPEKRIEAVQLLRSTIPEHLHDYYDALVDLKFGGVVDDTGAITVVLVHGIQTDGAWQKLVQAEFRVVPKLNVVCVGYEFYNALQLFGPKRSGPINKVTREIRDIQSREPNASLMVIAHSFGSYIISKLLVESPDIKFQRIILCGSIVPRDFRWDVHARELGTNSIVNDVGTKDVWPIVATTISFGYGASGRLGFQTGRVSDRYFPLDHSGFFKASHIKKFWLPFIKDGNIAQSKWDTKKPKTSNVLNLLSNVWQAKIAIVIAILVLVYLAGRVSEYV